MIAKKSRLQQWTRNVKLKVNRRPQGLELDLSEYGNPTEHQRGREKKLTCGDGGDMHPCPPL